MGTEAINLSFRLPTEKPSKGKITSIRVICPMTKRIDSLVDSGHYTSRSDFIRTAIRFLLEKEKFYLEYGIKNE